MAIGKTVCMQSEQRKQLTVSAMIQMLQQIEKAGDGDLLIQAFDDIYGPYPVRDVHVVESGRFSDTRWIWIGP